MDINGIGASQFLNFCIFEFPSTECRLRNSKMKVIFTMKCLRGNNQRKTSIWPEIHGKIRDMFFTKLIGYPGLIIKWINIDRIVFTIRASPIFQQDRYTTKKASYAADKTQMLVSFLKNKNIVLKSHCTIAH